MSNQLLATMAATMRLSRIPYGLIERGTWVLLHANDSLEKVIKETQVITGLNLMRDYPDVIRSFESCAHRRTPEICVHAPTSLQLEITPVLGADGHSVIALQCIALTTPQEASRQNEKVEVRFKHALEEFPLNAWMCSPHGEMFWVNHTANRFSHNQAVVQDPGNTYWMSKIPTEDLERANQIFGKALMDKVVVPYRYRVRDNHGRYHWHLCTYKPIYQENGEVLYWLGAGINIQEFVEQEERLEARIQELTQQNEKDKKLLWEANSLLATSQKMELVSNLASGVAHDLNNLLFIMSLNADQLYKLLHEPHLKGVANNVRATIKKAARLSSQLMGFSGRKPQSLSPVDPQALIRDIRELLDKAVGTETEFSIKVEEDTAMVLVDKMYLENSLINLAINARDAVQGRGSIVLAIGNCRHQRGEAPEDFVYFKMHDDGMGMPAEIIAKIYEPFFTTKAPGKGTGLGLPMVKTFVESSNGFMQVDSIPGVGTTFSLYLPCSNAVPEEKEDVSVELCGGDESILIVDDDVGVRETLARALHDLGYHTVKTAFNADYALQFLASGFKVDLIISDVRMPGRLTVLEFLHQMQDMGMDIPVIFATGYSAEIVVSEGLINAQYPVLHKPFTMQELSSRIRESLGDKEAVTQVTTQRQGT